METLLETALSNAAVVTILAVLVFAVSRIVDRPALVHALWVVVLLKLVTPPLFAVPLPFERPQLPVDVGVGITFPVDAAPVQEPLVPRSLVESPAPPETNGRESHAPATSLAAPAGIPTDRAIPGASPPSTRAVWVTMPVILTGIWALGILVCTLRTAAHLLRFRVLLRYGEPPSRELQGRLNAIAKRMGLRRVPQPTVVAGAVSPMIWPFGRRVRLVLPSDVIDSLSGEALDTLLTHELAHYRRRDHWVRGLELVGCTLFWWHPVVWWSLKQIRKAEEACCDAWVISQWPDRRRTYAEMLVRVAGFVAGKPCRLPLAAGALGQGLYQSIEQRVRSIMTRSPRGAVRLSAFAWSALLLFAVATLPLLPTWGADKNTSQGQQEDAPVEVKPTVNEPTAFGGSMANLQTVWSVAVSPDGKLVAGGHGGWQGRGALSVWHLKNKRAAASFPEQNGVMSVKFSPDGKLIAYATAAPLLRIRRTDTWAMVKEIKEFRSGSIHVAFSPDGKRLAVAGYRAGPTLFDTATWKPVDRTFAGDEYTIFSMTFSRDGTRLLASGGSFNKENKFGRTAVWDTATGRQLCAVPHSDPVMGADFAPNGKTFTTASLNPRVQVCDTETGEILRTVLVPFTGLKGMSYSPKGEMVAAIGASAGVTLVNPANGQRVSQFGKPDGRVRMDAGVFTPDASLIVTGTTDRKISVWDVASMEKVAEFPTNAATSDSDQPVLAVAASPDGKWIATGREDTTVTLHNGRTGDFVKSLKGHEDVVSAVAFSSKGMLATGGYDQTIQLWDIAKGTILKSLAGHENWVFGIAFSPDGKQLASCGYDKSIRLWDVESGKQTAVIEGHTAAVRSVAFSPDGKQLASAGSDRTVRVWDVATKNEVTVLKAHNGTVRSVAFSADGKQLATAGEDRVVKLWNTTGWRELHSLQGHEGMVWSVAFSAGGRNLASGSFDRSVKVWDPATGRLRQTLSGHTDVVSAVTFTPDTTALISGSLDRTVRRWQAASGR